MILDTNKDLIVMIDMINGFSHLGAFASRNVVNLIKPMQQFITKNIEHGVQTIHYTDAHTPDSLEFKTYPVHCLKGSDEAQVISELDYPEIEIIEKNSTNGFFAKNPFIYHKNLYIIGCVTDICIFEFALSAQKYIEEHQLPLNVHIIADLVTTFDAKDHNSIEITKQFLAILQSRGIKII